MRAVAASYVHVGYEPEATHQKDANVGGANKATQGLPQQRQMQPVAVVVPVWPPTRPLQVVRHGFNSLEAQPKGLHVAAAHFRRHGGLHKVSV